jgi:hypothetical protein
MLDHVISFAELNCMRSPCFSLWPYGRATLANRFRRLVRRGQRPAATTLWQRDFFDHVLRSSESYSEKWKYVRDNPVRAGLVSNIDAWKYAGEIETLIL